MADAGADSETAPVRLRLRRGEVQLACLDFGGSGTPVLLLHGLAGHAQEWSETARWLARKHRVVALDQRGHGHSSTHPHDVSREAHVEDVALVIARLGLAPVTLIGQSLGAHLAMLVAARHPELVGALIVAEASPDGGPGVGDTNGLRSWLEGWPTPFSTTRSAVEFFGGPSLYASAWAAGLREREDGLWPAFDIEVMVETLRVAMDRDHWDEWQAVRCPALVVRAGSGYFSSEHLEAMADRLPSARYAEIAGAKHDLHLDRPREWRAVLEEFLASPTIGQAAAG